MSRLSIEEFLLCWNELENAFQETKFPLNEEEQNKMMDVIRYLPIHYRHLEVYVDDSIRLLPTQGADSTIDDICQFFTHFEYGEKLEDMVRLIKDSPKYLSPDRSEGRTYEELWSECIDSRLTLSGGNLNIEMRAFGQRVIDRKNVITCISRSYERGMMSALSRWKYNVHNYVLGLMDFPVWEEVKVYESINKEWKLDSPSMIDDRYIPSIEIQVYLDKCLKLSPGIWSKVIPSDNLPKLNYIRPQPFEILKCLEDKAFELNSFMSEFDPGFADVIKCGAGWVYNDPDVKSFRNKHKRFPKKAPGEYVPEKLALDFFDLIRTLTFRDFEVGDFVPYDVFFMGRDKFIKGRRTLTSKSGETFFVDLVSYRVHSKTTLEGERAYSIYTLDNISDGGIPLSNISVSILTQPVFAPKKHAFKNAKDISIHDEAMVYQGDLDGKPFVKNMFIRA